MDRLPTEILEQIFYHLYYQDKVQCMLVCHKFERHLKSTPLFDSLQITTLFGFNQTVKRLQEYPKDGLGIKNLRLDLKFNKKFDQDFDLKQLTQYLPNLRTFSCYGKHDRKNQQYPGLVFHPLNNDIDHIIDESERLLFIPFLSYNKLAHLKKLTIKADGTPLNDIIIALENAPGLTNLIVKDMTITFDDIELLHEALPKLSSLGLEVKSLTSTRLPTDISPAILVTSFSFTAIGFVPICRQAEWVDYIRHKYTMLSEFSYIFNPNGYYLTDGGVRYREWFRPLLQQLGPQLKKLLLDAKRIPMNLFEILDHAGCQIQHLTLRSITPRLLEQLEKSNQRKHIKTLQTRFKNHSCQHWKNNSNQLTALSVPLFSKTSLLESKVPKSEVTYDDILHMCHDALTSLDIKVAQINPHLSTPYTHLSVQALSLTDTNLPDDFDHFISSSFPHLRYLKFINCKFNRHTLNMPNLSLSQLQIEEQQFNDDYKIEVITSNQKRYSFNTSFQSLVYLRRNSDSYKAPYRSVPIDSLNCHPDLTVICASLDKVYACHSSN
ncbi:hypothetical protein K501DRAFT_316215 [Backusella circina FSU 941]|nr:hypothetical protein K501DRAFT_316215 [Backusella circina FSU 941]